MIEVKAKLTRAPVYFANEPIACQVTVSNKCSDGHPDKLAWCSVQIHCFLNVDESKVRMPDHANGLLAEEQFAMANVDTSFHPSKNERGHVIFSSEPKILFCDLQLQSGEVRSFNFSEIMQSDSPPSYSGQALKYIYKISIGAQRLNSPIQFLKLPLKILSLGEPLAQLLRNASSSRQSKKSSLSEIDAETSKNLINVSELEEEVFETGLNNFCSNIPRENLLDVLMHRLDCVSAKRSPSTFIITNSLGKVGKFCVLKNTFKLGEDVIGVFDFSNSEVPCVQFSVTLQSEESINDGFRSKSKMNSQIFDHSKCQEFCYHTESTQIILPIPLTITPTFKTNIVNLEWKLHFEFVTTRAEEAQEVDIPSANGEQTQCARSLNVQTMVWDLPITILPTHPIQVGRALQMPASSVITI